MVDEPKPPRKRWSTRKRIGMGFLFVLLGLVVGLGLARWIWGICADRALAKEIAAIHAAGEPLAWSDLAAEPVSDDENAALLYLKAGKLLPDEWFSDALWDDGEAVPQLGDTLREDRFLIPEYRSEHAKECAEILELSVEPMALCRQARGLSKTNWGTDFSGPVLDTIVPDHSRARTLAKVLCLAALTAHEEGREHDALEYLLDARRLGQALGRMSFLIGALAGMSVDSMVCSSLEEITPTLQIGDPPAPTRKQVSSLIGELLDELAAREGFTRGIVTERAWQFDTIGRFRRGVSSVNQGRRLSRRSVLFLNAFQPMLKYDQIRGLQYMTQMVQASKEDNWPAMEAKWPVVQPIKGRLDAFRRLLSALLVPSLDKISVLCFRSIAMRRMTAVALAMRMYEIDHGKRPARLDDLVGDYLPAVPPDPFDPAGGPIRYAPDADPPVLYSVNEDGKDDGGAWATHEIEVWPRPRTAFEAATDDEMKPEVEIEVEELDLLYFLNGDRPYVEETATGRFGQPRPLIGLDGEPRGPAAPPSSMPAGFPDVPCDKQPAPMPPRPPDY